LIFSNNDCIFKRFSALNDPFGGQNGPFKKSQGLGITRQKEKGERSKVRRWHASSPIKYARGAQVRFADFELGKGWEALNSEVGMRNGE
jgi:hypothetical protein